MGIEKFFNSIKKTYGDKIISEFNNNSFPIKYFLIDFNSIIHNISSTISNSIIYLYHTYLISNTYPAVFNIQKNNINKHLKNLSTNDTFILESYIVLSDQMTDQEFDTESKYLVSIDFKEIILDTINESFFRLLIIEENLDKLIIHKVSLYINELIKSFPSLELLYLAIDGVPLYAKIIEQKKRRFIGFLYDSFKNQLLEQYKKDLDIDGSLSSLKSDIYYNHYKFEKVINRFRFNKSKISPATKFMSQLEEYIQKYLNNHNKRINIELDSYSNAGEGEKKIVFKIHELNKLNKYDFMIYSPDADVILLMLLESENNMIKIMRYDQQLSKLDIIDVNALKKIIFEYLNVAKDDHNIIKDIVMLFTILGNDFLPRLEIINTNKHIKTILSSYVQLKLVDQNIFNKTGIDWKLLKQFFINLKHNIHRVDSVKYKREWKLDPDQIVNSNAIPYYQHLFNVENPENSDNPENPDMIDEDINKITNKYLQGYEWLTKYYLDHELKYNFYYYNYKYRPTINQIIHNINLSKIENLDKTIREHYFDPAKQLIFITPYDVSNIIDPKYLTDELKKLNEKYNELFNKPYDNITNIYDYIDCKNAFYLSKCEINNFETKDSLKLLLH